MSKKIPAKDISLSSESDIEITETIEVPITYVDSVDDNTDCIKFEESEVEKLNDGVITLTDGTQWFKIPLSEVTVSSEENESIVEVVQVDDESGSNEITITNNSNQENNSDTPQIVVLEDGRIAYIQPVYSEGIKESSDEEIILTEIVKSPKKNCGKKYMCRVPGCLRSYSSSHHLKVHFRNHTGDRPYKCPIDGCPKAFITDYSRKAHLRTHTGEKPYVCPQMTCSKSFKTSGDLQKHIRTHTGERPFDCLFKGCNRSFTTSNIRKVHMRTHTGEKPYICTQEGCNRGFASSTNFKNHMRIHSGEKPYVCRVPNCLKRFTEYSSLYKHQLVHSSAKRHSCPFCHKSYRQASTLTTHKRTIHGVIAADDGTEIILEQMIGIGEDGTKNFKNITSKLLNLKRGHDSIDDSGSSLYYVSELNEENEDSIVEEILQE